MQDEIRCAVHWWTQQLAAQIKNDIAIEAFNESLSRSGYRSLSFHTRLDSRIVQAAKQSGIHNIEKLLMHARGKTLFVNPTHVKLVVDGAPRAVYLYRSPDAAASPSFSSTMSPSSPSLSALSPRSTSSFSSAASSLASSPLSTSRSASPIAHSPSPSPLPSDSAPSSPSCSFATPTLTQILYERFNAQYEQQLHLGNNPYASNGMAVGAVAMA